MTTKNYQKLVGKDTQEVANWWRGSIVTLLVILMITSLCTTFFFRAVLSNFNTNCIVNANIQFTNATKLNLPQEQLIIYQEKLRRIYQRDLEEKVKQSDRITEMFSFKNRKSNKKVLENVIDVQMAKNDSNIFATESIDESNTRWGSMTTCDYLCFIPFVEAIIAIVWLTLFFVCGRGGIGISSPTFVEEPWQMVAPAAIFFLVMVAISCIHSIILQINFSDFCDNLGSPFSSSIIPCGLLIDRFSINFGSISTPSSNFYTTLGFAWTTAILWIVIVCVMFLRCIFAADFKLVNVTVEDYKQIQINEENEK